MLDANSLMTEAKYCIHAIQVNEYRANKGKAELPASPGMRYLRYGVNNDGYWDNDKFAEQVKELLDCLHVLYPGHQIAVQVDWSAGHSKKQVGALNANEINMNYGGKKDAMRHSVMTEQCLGPHAAALVRTAEGVAVEIDCKLKPGDVQYSTFQTGDPPPWYQLDALADPVEGTDAAGETVTVKQGYEGQNKGLKQLLWERGMWEDGMSQLVAKEVLAAAQDYKLERSALENLLLESGDLLIMSPKGHPELAGKGIEYSWGMSKRHFRQHNDCVAARLHANIEDSVSPAVLDVERCRKFARKAREYMAAYQNAGAFLDVERLQKRQKSHRCTMWDEAGFLRRVEQGQD
jgi:hypothetical protein